MKRADVVVVGGSAAGIPAAITARRHYPEKSVLLVRREKQVSIPCGIPYIFGTVGSSEKNLIPDAMIEKNGIELVVDEVTGIDRDGRVLGCVSGEDIGYERLIIATGSSPVLPPIPGSEKENIFTIKKEVSYLQDLLDVLKDASNLVVVGGGYIGVEFADECRKMPGLAVTVVEMLPHCLMMAHDEEFCDQAQKMLDDDGVETLAPARVTEMKGDSRIQSVALESGRELKADVAIIAVGMAANVELAVSAGLELGPTGGIVVDRRMRTGDENIFACGDCAEKVSFFTGKPSVMKLASIATAEARIAGANLFGTRRENAGVLGVYSTVIGGCAFATAGLTEKAAKKDGFDVVCGVAEGPNRHPGGMPGAANLKLKLVFEKAKSVILGGQVSGADSAGEVMNIVSACVQSKMTADEIATFQTGTHPALTASPIAYQLVNAAEIAIAAMR